MSCGHMRMRRAAAFAPPPPPTTPCHAFSVSTRLRSPSHFAVFLFLIPLRAFCILACFACFVHRHRTFLYLHAECFTGLVPAAARSMRLYSFIILWYSIRLFYSFLLLHCYCSIPVFDYSIIPLVDYSFSVLIYNSTVLESSIFIYHIAPFFLFDSSFHCSIIA